MSLSELSHDCLLVFLKYLSDANVWRLLTAFKSEDLNPEELYWNNLEELVIDSSTATERDCLVIRTRILPIVKKLKRLKITADQLVEKSKFTYLPSSLIEHCRQIEDLDLSGIVLWKNDLDALSSLSSLKSLDINFAFLDLAERADESLGRLFAYNPCLRHVTLRDVNSRVKGFCFENLPRNIKTLKLFGLDSLERLMLVKCVDRRRQLETFHLGCSSELYREPRFISEIFEKSLGLKDLSLHLTAYKYIDFNVTLNHLLKLELKDMKCLDRGEIINLIKKYCPSLEVLILHGYVPSPSSIGNILAMGNLKELRLKNSANQHSKAGAAHGDDISRVYQCKKLETLEVTDFGFTEKYVIRVIRGCKNLIHITSSNCKVSTNLVLKAALALNEQKDRTSTLTLSVDTSCTEQDFPKEFKDNPDKVYHPLLKLEIPMLEIYKRKIRN